MAAPVVQKVRLDAAHGERLVHRKAPGDGALAAAGALHGLSVHLAPETVGDFLHARIGLRLARERRRTQRLRTHHERSCVHELLDAGKQLGTHRLELRKHQHLVCGAMRQHDAPFRVDARRLAQHLGVDVVELAAARHGGIHHASHLRHVFADEVCGIGNIESLLEHVAGSLEVAGEEIEMLEPCVVAVELVAEPGDEARGAVVGLVDVEMQDGGVDAVREEAVGARLEVHRRARVWTAAAGVGFGPYLALAVDVAAA